VETLFVGGGPATLGVLANAYHTNRIEDFVLGPKGFAKEESFKPKGIAIVDISEQFGGGSLQKHFGIKSNTSASGFLKVIMVPKQASTTAVNISD